MPDKGPLSDLKPEDVDLEQAIPDVAVEEVVDVVDAQVDARTDYSKGLEELKYRQKLHELKKQEQELSAERTMLGQRKLFSALILIQSTLWLGFIGVYMWRFGVVTMMPHSSELEQPKPISDAVMIALITTTTINVLGLFYIVARWLFPQPDGKATTTAATP